MGFPVRSIHEFHTLLQESQKPFCFVLLLDRDNLTQAGTQMLDLLTQFDEDSGDLFDFYLPGYQADERGLHNEWMRYGRDRSIFIERLGCCYFDRKELRAFCSELSRMSTSGWRASGDCEILLFQSNEDGVFWEDVLKACYSLDDVVRNGNTVNQFLLRLCDKLERLHAVFYSKEKLAARWREVKREVDEVYEKLVSPHGCSSYSRKTALRDCAEQTISVAYPRGRYVFISYSSKDFQYVQSLRNDLMSHGVMCWMAPFDIPAGTNYAYVIESAIPRCGLFLLIMSKSAARSVWVIKELLLAESELKKNNGIFWVWAEPPFDLDGTGFRYALIDVQSDDFSNRDENLWERIAERLNRSRLVSLDSEARWDVRACVDVLRDSPEFAVDQKFERKCPWHEFTVEDWMNILPIRSDLRFRMCLCGLSASEWILLLRRFPIVADVCPWHRVAEEFPWGCVNRVRGLDRYFPYARCSERMCVRLLRACPQQAKECGLEAMGRRLPIGQWKTLLIAQPSLSVYCHRWNEFEVADWVDMLKVRSELAVKCTCWNEFIGRDWARILSRRPELAASCDRHAGWQCFSMADWQHLLRYRPTVARNMMENRMGQRSAVRGDNPTVASVADRMRKWMKACFGIISHGRSHNG